MKRPGFVFFAASLVGLIASIDADETFGSHRNKERFRTFNLAKNPSILLPKQQQQEQIGVYPRKRDSWSCISSGGGSSTLEPRTTTATPNRKLPAFVYRLNASTKWIVAWANTIAIGSRIHRYEGPFVVIGAIMAVYFTDALKKILNHDRPEGAPFADPGMPSSHSLVSFFMAAGWTTLVLSSSPLVSGLVWASAGSIALLRVICGYHSYAQISVGALLGCSLGLLWAKLGALLSTHGHPKLVFRLSWLCYILSGGFFILKNVREWLYEDKHL